MSRGAETMVRPETPSREAVRAGRAADWREALHAEWTKLRTSPGMLWLPVLVLLLTLGVDLAGSTSAGCATAGCGQDAVKTSLIGVYLGQAAVAITAVLTVCGEYSTGLIRVTFSAMPRRGVVLGAKAVWLCAFTLAAGVLAVGASLFVARIVMPGHGFTAAHGYPSGSFTDGTALRAAGGTVLYLALIGLLSLGVAAVVRDSAAAIGTVLGLLYLSPILAAAVTDPVWHDRIERYAPMSAGLAVQATRNLAALPIGPWEGLGVLALWAAGALLAGWAVLARRDA
jgi:ABC-2 type transport system permease protein